MLMDTTTTTTAARRRFFQKRLCRGPAGLDIFEKGNFVASSPLRGAFQRPTCCVRSCQVEQVKFLPSSLAHRPPACRAVSIPTTIAALDGPDGPKVLEADAEESCKFYQPETLVHRSIWKQPDQRNLPLSARTHHCGARKTIEFLFGTRQPISLLPVEIAPPPRRRLQRFSAGARRARYRQLNHRPIQERSPFGPRRRLAELPISRGRRQRSARRRRPSSRLVSWAGIHRSMGAESRDSVSFNNTRLISRRRPICAPGEARRHIRPCCLTSSGATSHPPTGRTEGHRRRAEAVVPSFAVIQTPGA